MKFSQLYSNQIKGLVPNVGPVPEVTDNDGQNGCNVGDLSLALLNPFLK